MKFLTCWQLRKCLNSSPKKSLNLCLRVPLYSLFPQVLIPTSHLGWRCLSLLLPFSSTFHPYHQQSWWTSTSTVNIPGFSFGKCYSIFYFIIPSIQVLQEFKSNPLTLVAVFLTSSKSQLGSAGSRELTAKLVLWHSTTYPWKGWNNISICK